MVKSVRLCRTEPAIFKEDIIMSKIVNEAKIGHLHVLGFFHCFQIYTAYTGDFPWPSRFVMFRRCSWMISL